MIAKFKAKSVGHGKELGGLRVESTAVKKQRAKGGRVGVLFVVVGVYGENIFQASRRRVVKGKSDEFSVCCNLAYVYVV